MMRDTKLHQQHLVRWTFESTSEQDTDRLGDALASVLRQGDIVALNGELGAGKTRLVRGIVSTLCPEDTSVSSPTFVLIQQYEGKTPVFHFDAYRLAGSEEFLELGADEILGSEGICLIEWAERVDDVLPAECLRVDIRVTGPQSRQFLLTGATDRTKSVIEQVRRRLQSTGETETAP